MDDIDSYIVTTSYMCCCIDVKGGIVVATAPIMNWARGKELNVVEEWVEKKNGRIEKLK